MLELSSKQKKHLRGLAHEMNPIVNIGRQDLDVGVAKAIEQALLDHELIKVKVQKTCELDRRLVAKWVEDNTRAAICGVVGRVMVVYAPHPETPTLKLPR